MVHYVHVTLGSGIIFTKSDLRQLIRAWIVAFCNADTLCHAVTLTFDQLILKVRGTSSVTWSKSVRNLNEIKQSPAELLVILQICIHVMSCCDLDRQYIASAILSSLKLYCNVYDLPGEPKKIPPTTFVDITAMHGNFCTKFYTIVMRSNIHFITKFY